MHAHVIAVASDTVHRFSKAVQHEITLIAGLGVAGDAHAGVTIKHRSRVARDPAAPNLRQVHLIHAELFEELAAQGFAITPGMIGENVTTRGIDPLALGQGTRLQLGSNALIEITGLRNPCRQLDRLAPGLMQAVLGRTAGGELIRKAGIMATVIAGGTVRGGDTIALVTKPARFIPLSPV